MTLCLQDIKFHYSKCTLRQMVCVCIQLHPSTHFCISKTVMHESLSPLTITSGAGYYQVLHCGLLTCDQPTPAPHLQVPDVGRSVKELLHDEYVSSSNTAQSKDGESGQGTAVWRHKVTKQDVRDIKSGKTVCAAYGRSDSRCLLRRLPCRQSTCVPRYPRCNEKVPPIPAQVACQSGMCTGGMTS
jgi:hypothetical protein